MKQAYVGVFSGVFGITPIVPLPPCSPWDEQHQAALDNPDHKLGLKLVGFAIVQEDFLLQATRGTLEILEARGFDVEYRETADGHTWLNWRHDLAEFARLPFREPSSAGE